MVVISKHRLPVWAFFLCVLPVFGCGEYTAYHDLDRALRDESRGRRDAALAGFQAAVKACPGDAFLHRRLGWAYVQRKQYDAAQNEMEAALALEPGYLAVYQDLATLAEAREAPDSAIGWLERAIKAVPAYQPLYRDLSSIYLTQDRLSDAQTLLEQVVARWPKAMWAHYRLGSLFMQLKWPERAEAAFKHVVDLTPANDDEYTFYVQAYGALGNVYYEEKNYDSAAEFYKKAIELNPSDHSSLNNLAWVYAVQGVHLEEGLRLSRRALRLSPHSPTYLDTMAELYFKLGDAQQAEYIIRQAIAMDPKDPDLRAHLHQQLAKFMAGRQGKA